MNTGSLTDCRNRTVRARPLHRFTLIELLVVSAILLSVIPATPAEAKWYEQYRLDWYSWADLRAQPYLNDKGLRDLCDGDLRTGARGAPGPETGSTLTFSFPEAIQVTELRIVQQGAALLEITTDPETKAAVKTTLTIPQHKAQNAEWLTLPINRTIKGFRLIATSGKPPYRAAYPYYHEIEIYTDKPVTATKATPVKAGAPFKLGEAIDTPAIQDPQMPLTPCIDLWMTGLGRGNEIPDNYPQSKGFQRLRKQLEELSATGIRYFAEGSACDNKLPWKSKLGPSYGVESCKALVDAIHQQKLTVDIFLHAWFSPFQKEGQIAKSPYHRWDYPYEQSDFIFTKGLDDIYKVRYPCVISDDDFHDKWLGILSEAVDRGIDNVYVLPDEYYYKGHYLPKTNCPACRKAFKAQFGYDSLPKMVGDNEHYRKWKVFEYGKLAGLFNDVAGKLIAKKPGIQTICCPVIYNPSNARMEHGIALDILGAQPNFTAVQVYGGDPKRADAAFRNKLLIGSMQTLATQGAAPRGGKAAHPIIFHDYLMDLLMNGCTKINFYRLNYVEPYWKVAVKSFKMMRLLEAWGLADSQSAAETCVVISRASEDWWQNKADCEILDHLNAGASNLLYMDPKDLAVVWSKTQISKPADARVRHFQYERFRGMYSSQYVESLLKREGIQYGIRYSERPETLFEDKAYKLIILPFSYSMGLDTFARIRKAVEAGTKLLIYGELAPTNEFGVKHKEPLLKALLTHANVTHIPGDLAKDWSSRTYQEENRQRILKLLDSGFTFERNGADVHYLARKVADDDFLLYLGNMERAKIGSVTVGLTVPRGTYSLSVSSTEEGERDGIAVHQGLVHNQASVNADWLKRFTIVLLPGEVKLIHVERKQ